MSFRQSAAGIYRELSLLVGTVVIPVITSTAYLGIRRYIQALERSLLEADHDIDMHAPIPHRSTVLLRVLR
jgi:hypothetical protein